MLEETPCATPVPQNAVFACAHHSVDTTALPVAVQGVDRYLVKEVSPNDPSEPVNDLPGPVKDLPGPVIESSSNDFPEPIPSKEALLLGGDMAMPGPRYKDIMTFKLTQDQVTIMVLVIYQEL